MPNLKFDPTISYGHILTLVSMVVAVFIGWSTLDKRVVVLEENRNAQELRDKAQDSMSQANMAQLREALSEIKATLIRLDNKVEDLRK